MSFGQIIKGTLLPKVPLKELWEEDSSSENKDNPGKVKTSYTAPKSRPDTSQKTGALEPFIKIGGQIVKHVETMIIDETQFIPTITLSFKDMSGEFAGDYFPKVNLIMNVYLKSGSEKFKPIRCDFLITDVKSLAAPYTEGTKAVGKNITYMIKGELYIPGIYNNVSKSYSNLNSKDTLKKICQDLGLGFAENESSPNDKMTWINLNLGTYQFMEHIIKHAYQDDDSFFTAFIDKYYYLNYIEVNKQLKVEEIQKTFINDSNALASGINQNVKDDGVRKELEEKTTINYLTTEQQYRKAPNYITSLNLISEQGKIIKKEGYKKNIFYYDHLKSTKKPKEKFKDFFMEPLKSIDRKQEQYLVPDEISLAENKIKKWMGTDYGNNHPEWNASRLINDHNLRELNKIRLKVTLDNINFQVARGFTVPLYITVKEAERVMKATDTLDKEKAKKEGGQDDLKKQVPDEQLSGTYYVTGVKYYYDSMHKNGLYTELYLARREWKPSKK